MTKQKIVSFLIIKLLLICLIIATNSPTQSLADDVWTENASQAIERAVKEDKDLLLLFTGSDWCPPCKQLETEVLSNLDFQFEISKHFVLLKLDFPKEIAQDEELIQQNQEYATKFGVDAYPTVIMTDAQLKPFAIAGYEEGGFENYLGMLEESRQVRVNRDEKLGAAEKVKGLERAKLLDEAIGEMRQEIVDLYYPEIVEEIVALDKDNELGLREKWHGAKESEMRKVIMTDLMMISRLESPKRAIKFIDEVMDEIDFPANEKLQILQMKLNLVRQLKNPEAVDSLLDEMINLDGVEGSTRERLIVKKIYLMIGDGRDAAAMKVLDDAIADGNGKMHLLLARGEILDSKSKFADAIEAYDAAINDAKNSPDILIDLVSAKADSLFAMKKEAEALQLLDNFADDTQMPSDLRAEALLHQSMIMRSSKRIRQARLAENRAIEITESPEQRAQMQKIVDRLREKYGE